MVSAMPAVRLRRADAVARGSPVWPRKGLTATLDAKGQRGGTARAARRAASAITSNGKRGDGVALISIIVFLRLEAGDRPCAEQAVDRGVDIKAVREMDAQAGGGRVGRP